MESKKIKTNEQAKQNIDIGIHRYREQSDGY